MATRDEMAPADDAVPWRLSFRVHHSSADLSTLAARIGDAFGMAAQWLWRAGEPNQYAKPAGQVRSSSYCLVEWLDTGDTVEAGGTVEAALGDALAALVPLRQELARIVASGGRLDFFIGLFVDSMMGVTLPPALMARLAEMRIELQFDIYGGPRRAPMATTTGT